VPVAVGVLGAEVGGLISFGVLVVWVCGLLDLMTKRPDLDGRHRAAWILVIVLFPFLGTLGYFVVRPTLPSEREEMVAAQQAIGGTEDPHGRFPRRT
jgi:hypothetical protein